MVMQHTLTLVRCFWGRDVIRDLYHLHGKLAPPDAIDGVVLRTWRLALASATVFTGLRIAVKVRRDRARFWRVLIIPPVTCYRHQGCGPCRIPTCGCGHQPQGGLWHLPLPSPTRRKEGGSLWLALHGDRLCS